LKRLLVFGIFLFLSSFGFVEQTSAANFIVNDATSLIAAINTANSNNQDDIITFDSDIALTVANDFTQGVNGLPSILPDGGSSLTIEGNGFTLSRSGAAAFRIMHITAGANVFINDLTIENGLANASGIGSMGGAIFTWGQITIDNSIFTGNVADDGSSNGLGGAIAPADTTATITNSTFANNSATRNEGGASLSVSLDSITGANAGDFSIIGLPTAIGDTNPPQNIALICTPSASGLRTAQITFSTNDPMMPLVSYDLECIGTDNIVASASIVGINQVITEGATTVNVTVQLDVPAGFSDMGDVVVQITDAMIGNAASGADYTAFPTTNVTFAGPLTTGTYTNTVSVIVSILDDTAIEGAEALALEINSVTGAGEIGFPDTHTIVINDNDANIFAQASFVGNSAIINENAGTLTIDVQLSIPTGFNLTGNITLTISDSLGGIATSGTDYTAFAPPPVTFVDAPFVVGATYTQTITLDILDDALTEGVETVDLGITGISGGVELISPAQFTVIINDDEIATVIVTQPGGTVTVPVGDPEFVFKTVDNPFASIGQTVTYTIRARNPKTIPLTQVVIYDVFDERLSDIRLISTTHGKEVFNGNTLTVSDFTLQPNEEAIIIVSAKVATLKVGDTIPNAAILESPDASVHVSNLALVGANATGNSGDASQVFVIPNQLPNTGENPGWRNVILWAGGFLLALSAGLLIWGNRTKQHA